MEHNEKYYIIENDFRSDGMINHSSESRNSFASAESFYHERISKMRMNTQFTKVSILLVDSELNVIEHKLVNTCYSAENVAE